MEAKRKGPVAGMQAISRGGETETRGGLPKLLESASSHIITQHQLVALWVYTAYMGIWTGARDIGGGGLAGNGPVGAGGSAVGGGREKVIVGQQNIAAGREYAGGRVERVSVRGD